MLVLAVPVVGFNDMFADLIGYQLPEAEWVWWVSPILGTVMYAWGGWPFLTGAISEIRSRKPGMMLLIGLAITVAFVASWGASLRFLDHELNFWWELALLVVIMLLGTGSKCAPWPKPPPPWTPWPLCYPTRLRRSTAIRS